MFDLLKHFAFVIGMFYLLHLHDLLLLEDFDSIESLIVLRLDQMHTPEASSSKSPLNFEVRQRIFPLRSPHGRLGGCLLSGNSLSSVRSHVCVVHAGCIVRLGGTIALRRID